MNISNTKQPVRAIYKKSSVSSLVMAIVLAGLSLTVHAGKITSIPSATVPGVQDSFGGWNLDNIEVFLNDYPNSTFDEATGAYSFSVASDHSYASHVFEDSSNATLMGYVLAKDWPVGEPAGIKIVNDDFDVKSPKPTNCIMSTSYLDGHFLDEADPQKVLCSGPFQSHKRYKLAMLPSTVDGSNESLDLVFNVEVEDGSRDYQVYQKINNWTDVRLKGFTIEVGSGTGAAFVPASDPAGVGLTNLSLSVPVAIWDRTNQLANFSTGLFGPPDIKHDRPAGFFDPDTRAGYTFNEYGLGMIGDASGQTDKLTSGATLGSDYVDVPAGALAAANQFGNWLPNTMLPFGIFFDDDGNPDTDAELVAWYAYNPAITGFSWMRGVADGFAAVSNATISDTWSNDALYSMAVIDDLVNVGLNYVVTVGDVGASGKFTIRITPVKDDSGMDDPTYVVQVPTPTLVYTSSNAQIQLDPSPAFTPGNLLTVRVADADLNIITDAANPAAVETTTVAVSTDDPLVADAVVTLEELGPDRGVFVANLPDAFSNVAVPSIVTVSYIDVSGGTVPNEEITATSTASTEAGVIQFDPAVYTFDESGGIVGLTVKRVGGSVGTVTVEYSSVSGTATGGEDYTAVTGALTFFDGVVDDSKEITIPLLDDTLAEVTESFNVLLSNVQGGAALSGTADNALVSITDNDLVTVQFSSATFSAAENDGTVTVTVERNNSVGALTVDYASDDIAVAAGYATEGVDYTAVSGTLSFADGESTKDIVVTILDEDDVTYEGSEIFNVVLSNLVEPAGAVIGTIGSTEVTITENDPGPGELQFSSASYSAVEDSGSVTVSVERISGSVGAVSVDYAFTNGSADASDYTAVNGTLNFTDGVITQDIVVPLLADTLLEADETFVITLDNVVGAALGAITTTEVSIVNDDVAGELQFTSAAFSADEGGNVIITVARIGGSSGDISVDYAFTDGSADASDYTAVNGTLNIAHGDLSGTILVALVDDGILEGDETFVVTLDNVVGGASLGAITSTEVTIVDTDAPASNDVVTSDDDNGLFGLGLSWITAGLLGLGLLLRRKRF